MAPRQLVIGFAVVWGLASCGGGSSSKPTTNFVPVDEGAATGGTVQPSPEPATSPGTPDASKAIQGPTGPVIGGSPNDSPEISRSVGGPNDIVVLWTRVVPKTTDAKITQLAGNIQARVRAAAMAAFPGRTIDLRPQPERVCPRAGCKVLSVGALLLHSNGGCAVVALVTAAGTTPTRLFPWAGQVDLKRNFAPFREPPESNVVVRDYAPCSLDPMAAGDDGITAAIQATR